ncbi:hypothetical protein, partial [Escherichia coli]
FSTNPNETGPSQSGGGRNAQKSNPDRVAAAQQRIEKARTELQALRSKPNKTPQDKVDIEKLQKGIKRDQLKTLRSENHS